MSRLSATLRRIGDDLDDLRCKWALVGGLAVSARADPRTTRDVDIAVLAESDDHAEAIVFELTGRGYQVLATVEQRGVGRLATVRLAPPAAGTIGPVVDLLFCSSGIEPEAIVASERIEVLPGVTVPVARIPHLVAMKLLARDDRTRPQDYDDLRGLLVAAAPQDIAASRDLLRLMIERGTGRGKTLLDDFEGLLEELGLQG